MRDVNGKWQKVRNVVTALAVLPACVLAGGSKIPDQSTRAMGMLDAFVAGADDASAVYYNPAGLTRLSRPEIINNAYIAHTTAYSSGPGVDETSDGRTYFVPNFYGAMPLADTDLALGIGVYSPFGLGARWGDDTRNASWLSLAEIQLANVNPTVAWQPVESLSLGLGLDFFQSRAVTRFVHPLLGEVDIDTTGDGWGYNFGIQYQWTPELALGATYRSAVDVHYEGDLDIDTPAFRGSADSELTYPQSISLGVAWQATDKLRLEVVLEWDEWSSSDLRMIAHNAPVAMLGPSPFVVPLNWDDSWIVMLGGEYQLSDRWALRAGYAFNETPVPASTADPSLPTDDTHVLGLGAGCRLSDALTLDAALVVAYGTERTLTNATFPLGSDYKAISTYVSLGATYRF